MYAWLHISPIEFFYSGELHVIQFIGTSGFTSFAMLCSALSLEEDPTFYWPQIGGGITNLHVFLYLIHRSLVHYKKKNLESVQNKWVGEQI